MTDIELEMQARLSEWRDNATKYEIVMIFLSAVTCLWLILTLYVTIRFLVSFRFMKKLFAVFLLMLNLALIGRFLYIVDEAFLNRPRHWENRSNWSEGLISYSGTFFFSLAGLLNIYNWLYFTVSFKTIFESRVLYKQKVKKIVSILFFPSILLIILLFSGGFIWSWAIPDASKGNFNNQVLIKYFSLVTQFFKT